ncbi:hypothetical protein [Shewanella sp. SACH]|uniref:hypothetical protein n=1 Tax=Shewanella sp. SACH TaxID=1873135 RepID=UPI0020168D96|nr:hypothetical protein [Shewanella sp. SACH]
MNKATTSTVAKTTKPAVKRAVAKPRTPKPVSLISKEQWQQIETEMAGSFVNVKFGYKGHEIHVQRERKDEATTCLSVYIDTVIKGAWMCQIKNLPEDAPKIIPDVWSQRTIAKYKQKMITQIEKVWGKRLAKKEYPELHGKIIWLCPYFSKASVLCRQFKKLEGLELTKAACLKNEPVFS